MIIIIIYRDLKPENLLMTGKSDDANVKIADFGFATKANGLDVTGFCGTPGIITHLLCLLFCYHLIIIIV